jgi:hypothetical protein
MPETVDPTDRPHGCSGASLPGGDSSAKVQARERDVEGRKEGAGPLHSHLLANLTTAYKPLETSLLSPDINP